MENNKVIPDMHMYHVCMLILYYYGYLFNAERRAQKDDSDNVCTQLYHFIIFTLFFLLGNK